MFSKKRKMLMEEAILDSKMKVHFFKEKILDTIVEDHMYFSNLQDPKPDNPFYGASIGMTSCEDISSLSKRKLDIYPSLHVAIGNNAKHSFPRNRVTSKVEGSYLEHRDSKIRKIHMVETQTRKNGHISQDLKVNLDNILHCTHRGIETVKTEYNADKYSSLD
jgi:hypothetical protein